METLLDIATAFGVFVSVLVCGMVFWVVAWSNERLSLLGVALLVIAILYLIGVVFL